MVNLSRTINEFLIRADSSFAEEISRRLNAVAPGEGDQFLERLACAKTLALKLVKPARK
jgi:hypothetical protein